MKNLRFSCKGDCKIAVTKQGSPKQSGHNPFVKFFPIFRSQGSGQKFFVTNFLYFLMTFFFFINRILGKEFHKPDLRKTVSSEYFREMRLTKCDKKIQRFYYCPVMDFITSHEKIFPMGSCSL